MNRHNAITSIAKMWDETIVPTLCQYVLIPNKSPAFDPDWEANGYMQQAVTLLTSWCEQQQISGMKLQVLRSPGKTPLILIEIPGQIDETVMLYGHLDKQPEMTGWASDLGPWQPVIKGNRLYGRGAADDGYAIFAALSAIKLLQQEDQPHARCIIIIEASEESGSSDLPFYIEKLKPQLPNPSLVICLDSGCGNYEQLWCTTSLRGLITAVLRVAVLEEGVHSGSASGIAPSSFRILRQLISRVEEENTGEILLPEFNVAPPPTRLVEAKKIATTLGENIWRSFPFIHDTKPVHIDCYELALNRAWRPALSLTGIGEIPALENAGNVLRPATSALLSIRLPPTADANLAAQALKKVLESAPPYGAHVTVTIKGAEGGWDAPETHPWLTEAINNASLNYYGKEALYWGEGGSIPFMGILGKMFPAAQFMVTGVLGPHSNAHGPNEFLDIDMAKKLTCCISEVLSAHFQQFSSATDRAMLSLPDDD